MSSLSNKFQYVVTSGRRLCSERRICRFEADHTDQLTTVQNGYPLSYSLVRIQPRSHSSRQAVRQPILRKHPFSLLLLKIPEAVACAVKVAEESNGYIQIKLGGNRYRYCELNMPMYANW